MGQDDGGFVLGPRGRILINQNGGVYAAGAALDINRRLNIVIKRALGVDRGTVAREERVHVNTVDKIHNRYLAINRILPLRKGGLRQCAPILQVPELFFLKASAMVDTQNIILLCLASLTYDATRGEELALRCMCTCMVERDRERGGRHSNAILRAHAPAAYI